MQLQIHGKVRSKHGNSMGRVKNAGINRPATAGLAALAHWRTESGRINETVSPLHRGPAQISREILLYSLAEENNETEIRILP
jgi:hypothetical protein